MVVDRLTSRGHYAKNSWHPTNFFLMIFVHSNYSLSEFVLFHDFQPPEIRALLRITAYQNSCSPTIFNPLKFVLSYEFLLCSIQDYFFTIEFPYSSDSLFVNKITAFESDLFRVFAYHSCCSLLVNFIFCIFFILIIFYYYYRNPISLNYRKCHYRKCQ